MIALEKKVKHCPQLPQTKDHVGSSLSTIKKNGIEPTNVEGYEYNIDHFKHGKIICLIEYFCICTRNILSAFEEQCTQIV